VLIAKVMADIEQTIAADDNAGRRVEGQKLVQKLAALKDDMQYDRPLR